MIMVGGICKRDHSRLHTRLKKKYGRANRCDAPDCNSINPKRFEWALKKGHNYSDSIDDYIPMCPSCHRKYDFNENIRQKLRDKKYGDRHNAAKLSNAQVLEIVILINNSRSNKEIAADYCVHPTTICDIKRGKRWGYLTGIKYLKPSKNKP